MQKFSYLKEVPVSAWLIHGMIFTTAWLAATSPLWDINLYIYNTPPYVPLFISSFVICTIFDAGQDQKTRAIPMSSWKFTNSHLIFFSILITAISNAIFKWTTHPFAICLVGILSIFSLYLYLNLLSEGPSEDWNYKESC